MVVVDASIWVAAFRKKDKFYADSNKLLRDLFSSKESIAIPEIAFAEVAGALKRITGDTEVVNRAMLNMERFKPKILDVDHLNVGALAKQIAINHSIRGADACYLAVAQLTESKELHTTDKDQKTAFEKISKAWKSKPLGG